MRTIGIAALIFVGLEACATTAEATAEERAYCEEMEREMGTRTTHDHSQMRGGPPNAMNLTHERCQQILRAPE